METLELIKRARSGDKLAREQVIEENMGLVYSIVKRFAGTSGRRYCAGVGGDSGSGVAS